MAKGIDSYPTRYNLPRRNCLISARSDKLIVIVPGKGSGALTTAEYERKYGREGEILVDLQALLNQI